ncbi:MAG: helix-turn-helix domain-containing protein [Bacillota bacterium]
MLSLAEKVVRLRERKGWSQEQLAAAASIGASTIAHIERGSRTACRPATLRALAGALEVPVEYFTTDSPSHYLRVRLATLPAAEAAALGELPLHQRLRLVLADLEEKWGEAMSVTALARRLGLPANALEDALDGRVRSHAAGPALLFALAAEIGLPGAFLLPSPGLVERYAEALALAQARGLTPEALCDLIARQSG